MILFSEINTISNYVEIDDPFFKIASIERQNPQKTQIRENSFCRSNQHPRRAVVLRKGAEIPEEPKNY